MKINRKKSIIIVSLLLSALILGVAVGSLINRQASADAATDEAQVARQAEQVETTARARTKKIQATASKLAAKKDSQAVAAQQQSIKADLHTYLNEVGAAGNIAVSFYNLAPVRNSAAARSENAAVYQAGKLSSAVNGDLMMPAASTYKLYIAAYLFDQVEHGRKTWTAADDAGFQDMVLNSGNTYSEAQLALYSDATIDAFISKQGWQPVFAGEQAMTNSNDLCALLQQLQQGRGAFADHALQQMLLTAMSQQIYREGIPAAEPGAVVQDKVGFYETNNNDAAIVTTPAGQRFVLVIMTEGYTILDFSKINEIATQVQQIVYGD